MVSTHGLREAVSLQSILLAPVRPRTYRRGLYLGLLFPLGAVYSLVLFSGLLMGISTAIFLVGLPLLVGTALVARGIGWLERRLTSRLLGADVLGVKYGFTQGSLRDRLVALGTDAMTWRELLYVFSMSTLGVGVFSLVFAGLTTSISVLATPLYYDTPEARVGLIIEEPVELTQSLYVPWGEFLVGAELGITLTQWVVDSLWEALAMSAVGVVLLGVTLILVDALGWLWGRYAELLLSKTAYVAATR